MPRGYQLNQQDVHTSPQWRKWTEFQQPGNFPRPARTSPNAGISYMDHATGDTGRSVSNTSRSSSANASVSRMFQSLNDGKTIDLSPSEWTRVQTEMRSTSRSTLYRLAKTIIDIAKRRNVYINLLEWAFRFLDEYYRRRPDTIRREGGPSLNTAAGWHVDAQCSTGPLTGGELRAVYWQSPSHSPWSGVTNCLSGQVMAESPYYNPKNYNGVYIGEATSATYSRLLYQLHTLRSKEDGREAPYIMKPNVTFTVPSVNPFSWFNPDLSLPGDGPVTKVPPVRQWSRAPGDSPQSRQVGDGTSRTPDVTNTVTTWTFGPPNKPPNKQEVKTDWSDRGPPPSKTKEKKIAFYAAGTALRILNILSETKDFVDAWWDAIPREHRSRKYWKFGMKKASSPRLQQKLWEIYQYMAYLERTGKWSGAEGRKYLSNATWNVGVNQVNDFVYGRIGQTSGRAARAVGRPHGYQMGPAL